MPIKQKSDELSRAEKHIKWLVSNFPSNVTPIYADLTKTFDTFMNNVITLKDSEKQHLTEANTRSRLRMVILYYYASFFNCLVVGTGNKVEDYGIGFFSKFGDGGVDISPIGDLMKSEVRALGKHMGVLNEIINAIPSDGLWPDGRSDEQQIGATYDELEWAMENIDNINTSDMLSTRQKEVLVIYKTRHDANKHKMEIVTKTFNKSYIC